MVASVLPVDNKTQLCECAVLHIVVVGRGIICSIMYVGEVQMKPLWRTGHHFVPHVS